MKEFITGFYEIMNFKSVTAYHRFIEVSLGIWACMNMCVFIYGLIKLIF